MIHPVNMELVKAPSRIHSCHYYVFGGPPLVPFKLGIADNCLTVECRTRMSFDRHLVFLHLSLWSEFTIIQDDKKEKREIVWERSSFVNEKAFGLFRNSVEKHH